MEIEEISVSYILIIGTLGMVIMAIAIISFIIFYQRRQMKQQATLQRMRDEYQKELLNATFQTQEVERRRIAQDLHDEIGALLSTAKLGVDQMGRMGALEQVRDASKENKKLMDEVITNVRRISKDLLPATLEDFGLPDAINELVKKVRGHTHFDVNFKQSCARNRFAQERELSLYRVVQELINNSLKHSGGKQLDLDLVIKPDHLRLVVQDDGEGFDLQKTLKDPSGKRGLGLKNIVNRLGMHDAEVDYQTSPGEGTRVVINMDI